MEPATSRPAGASWCKTKARRALPGIILLEAMVFLITLGPPNVAKARSVYIENLRISGAWVRPSLGQTRNSAAYLAIQNFGNQADRLIGVSAAIAERAGLHQQRHDDGVMRMRPIEGGVNIPPGGRVAFEPGGNHIMLFGLKTKLLKGGTLDLELLFEKAGKVPITAAVRMSPPRRRRGSY